MRIIGKFWYSPAGDALCSALDLLYCIWQYRDGHLIQALVFGGLAGFMAATALYRLTEVPEDDET